jgi:hypothetical protein
MSRAATAIPRELAHRANDGVLVTLLWHGETRVTLLVDDTKTGESFELAVEPDCALQAFYHPFALLHLTRATPLPIV